jgi:hypothetical protein
MIPEERPDPSHSDWESTALANHPRFVAIIEKSRRSYREQGGIGIEQLRRELVLVANECDTAPEALPHDHQRISILRQGISQQGVEVMFWGQPYCQSCGYTGPDFMWMWHIGRGLHVLLQDQESLALRVVEVPDDDAFWPADGQSQEARRQAADAYVESVLTGEQKPTERRVPAEHIWRWEFEDHGRTDLSCPGCRAMLCWRGTGIS